MTPTQQIIFAALTAIISLCELLRRVIKKRRNSERPGEPSDPDVTDPDLPASRKSHDHHRRRGR